MKILKDEITRNGNERRNNFFSQKNVFVWLLSLTDSIPIPRRRLRKFLHNTKRLHFLIPQTSPRISDTQFLYIYVLNNTSSSFLLISCSNFVLTHLQFYLHKKTLIIPICFGSILGLFTNLGPFSSKSPFLSFEEAGLLNSVAPFGGSVLGVSSLRCLGMQSQIVCSGCRSILLYPRGATNVCCALCSAITSVPPPGMEMAQLICGGCRTLLMYTRGATSVRCSCCHTVNLAPVSNQVAQINCGNCRTTLMYPNGAPSVKCALCHYITNTANMRIPLPANRPNGTNGMTPSSSIPTQTVVVENPMSVDESGKLVSNVVVGVTTEKK